MPKANKQLRLARNDFSYNYANLMVSPKIFENLNNLTIYVQDRQLNKIFGILIYDNRNKEYAITITAETGDIVQNQGKVLLYLNHGTVQKFNFISQKSDILKFDSYIVNLNEKPQKELEIEWKASERYIYELLNPDPEETISPRVAARYHVEFHQRITYPLFSIVLTLIATAFLLKGQFNRRGNLSNSFTATILAISFVGSVMFVYDMIEKFPDLTILLYMDLLFFIIISLFTLNFNGRKIFK